MTDKTVQKIIRLEKEVQRLKSMLSKVETQLKTLDISTHEVWYQEYQEGKTFAQLGEKYQISPATIHIAFKQHGWATRKRTNFMKPKETKNEGA
jgi:hypothetical protein